MTSKSRKREWEQLSP